MMKLMFFLITFFYLSLSCLFSNEVKVLKSIEYFDRTSQKLSEIEFQYDENAFLQASIAYTYENKIKEMSTHIKYSYPENGWSGMLHSNKDFSSGTLKGNKIIRETKEKERTTYRTLEYFEDEKELFFDIISISNKNTDTIAWHRQIFSYNDDHKIITYRYIINRMLSDVPFEKTVYTYDLNGHIKTKILDGEEQRTELKFFYDSKERLTSSIYTQYSKKSNLNNFYEDICTYDERGNLTKKEYNLHYPNKQPLLLKSEMFVYDTQGNLLTKQTVISDKNEKEEYVYNSSNLVTIYRKYTSSTNHKMELTVETKTTYNTNGLLLEQKDFQVKKSGDSIHTKLVNKYSVSGLWEQSSYYTLRNGQWIYSQINKNRDHIISKRLGIKIDMIKKAVDAQAMFVSNMFYHRLENYYEVKLNWGASSTVDAANKETHNPSNYPNPASQSTTIKYFVDTPAFAELTLFDANGMKLFRRNLGFKTSGNNEENIDVSNLKNGTYFYMVKIGEKVQHRKLIVRK